MDWLDLLTVHGTLKGLLQQHSYATLLIHDLATHDLVTQSLQEITSYPFILFQLQQSPLKFLQCAKCAPISELLYVLFPLP